MKRRKLLIIFMNNIQIGDYYYSFIQIKNTNNIYENINIIKIYNEKYIRISPIEIRLNYDITMHLYIVLYHLYKNIYPFEIELPISNTINYTNIIGNYDTKYNKFILSILSEESANYNTNSKISICMNKNELNDFIFHLYFHFLIEYE